MIPGKSGYIPDPDFPEKIRQDIGKIKDPMVPEFEIKSMAPLLDSSNMCPDDWDRIAREIDNEKANYGGFIVLHGTDTMAYTASALAFMLKGLNNNIIITGSQIPYCQVRNDARENLISSLIICGNYEIPEVALYFNNKLLRGCRSTKVDATCFDAFDSPNYPLLAEIGVNINLKRQWSMDISINESHISDKLSKTTPVEYFNMPGRDKEFEVGVLRLFPGISARFVQQILDPKLKGLVLESYGVGNGPTKENNPELFKVIREATSKPDTVIVAVTQCLRGSIILGEYAASLKEAGVISGYDMTVEAALAKLYFLISKQKYDLQDVNRLMQENLIGELTETGE